MNTENIAYMIETKRHIEWSIRNAPSNHARYRMDQALNYINGALKAAQIGMDERAWFAFDKANYWMSQARGMCREDGESEGRKTPKNPSLQHRERCRLMT